MSDADTTKVTPRQLLDAEAIVEVARYATGGDPATLVASMVGAIILVCATAKDPAGALGCAMQGLEMARVLAVSAADRATRVPS